MANPRYRLEAVGFKCVDESGIDIFGSDEPRWFCSWTNGKAPKTVPSREFGDIDSGDTRRWNPPLRITPTAVAAPLAVSIQLYEIDQGDPEKMRVAVERAVTAANLASLVTSGTPVSLPDSVKKQLVNLLGNDLMGSATVAFSEASLRKLRRPGHSLVRTLEIGGKSGDLPFEVAGGPDYEITLRVVRDRDAN
jgi:hypothetical protein